ncbi:MAG: hypothetical protein K9K66_09210 [Desulfarculaceae bacterium]|nr:hypothetical protein [Desulfarculaceae bacterium]MCF8073090.1 hypothetical protein [Desulfarculaceae bacterium]MCF8101825.1 hypothetical protein [Desulfarculaceae bacterium]MCF8115352.1 hypothetical protein [Desulfarculaceae bacterium]
MTEKSISALVFALLAFIAFPLAIIAHFHLYADGAWFLSGIFQENTLWPGLNHFPPSTRGMALWLLQFPTQLAIENGVLNVRHLSYIFGASLYYMPLICYAATAYILYRKGRSTHATLLVLMYTILVYFSSYFIISESHLATGLFLLIFSIMATCDLRRAATLVALLCLGGIAVLTYQFWTVFFPVCLGFFLLKIRKLEVSYKIRIIHLMIIVLYAAGFVANAVAIFLFHSPNNRNAMILGHLEAYWPIPIVVCLLFGLLIFYVYFNSTATRYLNRIFVKFNGFSSWRQPGAIFTLALWVGFAVFVFLYSSFHGITFSSPGKAYALRSLNLILPLFFALSFVSPEAGRAHPLSARAIALCCLFPMMVLTMQASLSHTKGWLDYKRNVYAAARQNTGFVSIKDAKSILNSQYRWVWTTPSVSIAVQAIAGKDIKSILFNPDATWEPYGPSDREGAAACAKSMGKKLLF